MQCLLVNSRLNCIASTVDEVDGVVVNAEGSRLLGVLEVIWVDSTERGKLWLVELVLKLELGRVAAAKGL